MGVDRLFVAGFVAGEGHFWIAPNNSGQSWSCGFELCQRDDGADLVAAVRDVTGCGAVRRVPACNTSQPQVLWSAWSMQDCSALAVALADVPMLGKKAGEFAIWRRAVAAWSNLAAGSSRWNRLERFASALRAHRAPDFVADYTRVDITTREVARFLAGFASAEGHFGASTSGRPRFVIKLRADDTAVLSMLAARFAVGRLFSIPPSKHGRAQTAWIVTRLEELRSLVALFDRNPPLGRAGRVYPHWRRLVLASDRRGSALARWVIRMRAARRYQAPSMLPISPTSSAAKHERYIATLTAWARDAGPPYTATSYERWRALSRARTPTRNTLASFFGSWREALAAAGLSGDGTRSPETIARALERGAGPRAEAEEHQRSAVLRAVRRCWSAMQTVPTATEFFRWRLEHAPASPGQAQVYRLFPGGWPSVLDLLEAPAQPVHVAAAAREELAREPDVEAGAAGQLGHEGVAGHEVAAGQRQ
jgi:hypothetical protein